MIVLKKVVYAAQWQIASSGIGFLLPNQHSSPLQSVKKRINTSLTEVTKGILDELRRLICY